MGKGRRKSFVVYGIRPVEEALVSDAVKPREVAVAPGLARRDEILHLAASRGVPARSASPDELSGLAKTREHQGAVAVLGPFEYLDLEGLVDRVEGGSELPVVALDSITDPHNLGAIARSAHFFGAAGLITTKDRAAPVTPAAVKVSAGALLHLSVAREANLTRSLERLKEAGCWVAGSSAHQGEPPWDLNLTGRVVIVVGSEDRGLKRITRKACDLMARIPGAGGLSSLNAAAAAGVLLYEAARQRAGKEG